MHDPLMPSVEQVRQHAIGDARHLAGNADVEAGNVAQMLHASSAQYGPASQSNPVSAGDGNKSLSQLLFHRIQ
ncbi:hypothetical protein D3C81_1864040 [compost metagenome]